MGVKCLFRGVVHDVAEAFTMSAFAMLMITQLIRERYCLIRTVGGQVMTYNSNRKIEIPFVVVQLASAINCRQLPTDASPSQRSSLHIAS